MLFAAAITLMTLDRTHAQERLGVEPDVAMLETPAATVVRYAVHLEPRVVVRNVVLLAIVAGMDNVSPTYVHHHYRWLVIDNV